MKIVRLLGFSAICFVLTFFAVSRKAQADVVACITTNCPGDPEPSCDQDCIDGYNDNSQCISDCYAADGLPPQPPGDPSAYCCW